MAGVELYAPRKASHRRTWTAAAVVLAVVFIFLGQALAVVPALMTGLIGLDGATDRWDQLAYILFAAFGVAAALTIGWVILFERRGLATIGFNGRAGLRFVRGYLIGLAFLAGVVGIIWALGGYGVESFNFSLAVNSEAGIRHWTALTIDHHLALDTLVICTSMLATDQLGKMTHP